MAYLWNTDKGKSGFKNIKRDPGISSCLETFTKLSIPLQKLDEVMNREKTR